MAFEEKNVNEKQYYLLDKSYNKDGFTIAKSPSASAIYEEVKNLSDKYINDPNQEDLKGDMEGEIYHWYSDYDPTENQDFGWYVTKHKWEIEESDNGKRELRAAVEIKTKIHEEDYDEKTNDIQNIYVQELSENYDEEFVKAVKKERPESEIQKFRLDDCKHNCNLNELAKEGRKTAQTDEKPQKETYFYQLWDEGNRELIKNSRSASEMADTLSDTVDKYIHDPEEKELHNDIIRTFCDNNDYQYYEQLDDNITDRVYSIYAFPESEIESFRENGKINFKEGSEMTDEERWMTVGEAVIETNFIEGKDEFDDLSNAIESQSVMKNFSKEFVESVKKEKPQSKIQQSTYNIYDPHNKESFSLDDLAKKGREAAMQKEQSEQTKQISRKNQEQR